MKLEIIIKSLKLVLTKTLKRLKVTLNYCKHNYWLQKIVAKKSPKKNKKKCVFLRFFCNFCFFKEEEKKEHDDQVEKVKREMKEHKEDLEATVLVYNKCEEILKCIEKLIEFVHAILAEKVSFFFRLVLIYF